MHIQDELKSGGGVDSSSKSDIDASLERLNKIESTLWGFILNKSHKDHLRALAEWEADLAWIQDSKKLWLQEIA